jgi:integrase
MNEQLPAIIDRTGTIGDIRAHVVPALIAAAGERASLRFLEFFAANIRNPHTRGLFASGGGIYDLVRGQRREIDHGRAAASRLGLDRAAGREHAAPPAGLRDRALIALMVFSFARIGAALSMKVEDVFTPEPPAIGAAAREGRQAARHAVPPQS